MRNQFSFWDRDTDCIINVRIVDVNQLSYLSRKPTSTYCDEFDNTVNDDIE